MKHIFILVISLVIATSVSAQHFQHGAGLGVTLDNMVEKNIAVGSVLTYNPRFNFHETENVSVSVGIPLSVGYTQNTYVTDAYYNDERYHIETSYSFLVQAPVMVNFNFGGGSSPLCHKHIGGFVGAGYAFNYFSPRDYYVYDDNDYIIGVDTKGGSSAGPAANAGIRIAIGKTHTKSIEIKLSWYHALGSNNKFNVFGIGAAFNF